MAAISKSDARRASAVLKEYLSVDAHDFLDELGEAVKKTKGQSFRKSLKKIRKALDKPAKNAGKKPAVSKAA